MSKMYRVASRTVWFIETLKSYGIADPLRRLSRQNLLRDYRKLLPQEGSPLWQLHQNLEDIREQAETHYDGYDYGSGYYYQSLATAHISGYRKTGERVQKLGLGQLLKGKSVLDIGSNSGFLLLTVANEIDRGVGVEFNPYLVKAADATKAYFKADNVSFVCSAFEDFADGGEQFDVVLSLANHSTYDGNTKQTVASYFAKCASLLRPDGMLVFESHAPQIEPPEKLAETLGAMANHFSFDEPFSLDMRGFLDRGRSYVIAHKRT